MDGFRQNFKKKVGVKHWQEIPICQSFTFWYPILNQKIVTDIESLVQFNTKELQHSDWDPDTRMSMINRFGLCERDFGYLTRTNSLDLGEDLDSETVCRT